MDIASALKIVGTIIGIVAALWAFIWKFPDRRRQIHMDQHKILQPILDKPLEEQHDLVLETMFRFCFGETVSASEVRFLLGNSFPLVEIERFCFAKDHLCWDENSKKFQFNGWNKHPWYRWTKISIYTLLYGVCIMFAFFPNLIIRVPDVTTAKSKILLLILFLLLLIFAGIFLWLGSKLVRADRFIRRLPTYSISRDLSEL